jgi:hypothetical protein
VRELIAPAGCGCDDCGGEEDELEPFAAQDELIRDEEDFLVYVEDKGSSKRKNTEKEKSGKKKKIKNKKNQRAIAQHSDESSEFLTESGDRVKTDDREMEPCMKCERQWYGEQLLGCDNCPLWWCSPCAGLKGRGVHAAKQKTRYCPVCTGNLQNENLDDDSNEESD